MRFQLRITADLLAEIRADLRRPHPFAFERVGFLTCRVANLPSAGFLILSQMWHTVADDDYINDPSVGAMLGPGAFRKILQYAYANRVSVFHAHIHEHEGNPGFS